MQTHEKVKKLLPRVEAVEQLYDGLNGKIIKWTLEHGNTSHDPSALAFLVARDGQVLSKCPNPYSGSSFAKWMEEEVKEYERTHPRTAVPLVMAGLVKDEDGKSYSCPAFDEAREAGKPVLLYAGRDARPDDSRKLKKEVKAARRLEKRAFGSKKAAEAAKGWVLLRLNLGEKEHAVYAKSLGIESAPAVLMFLPGEEKPVDLGTRIRGANLEYHFKKHAPKKTDAK